MRFAWRVAGHALPAAILAVILAGAWYARPSMAQERGVPGHEFREHEFHEHEFHDRRFLDSRYHHDHYYPPTGFVFGALPPGYVSVGFGNAHFFFSAGVWYRTYAPGRYVVVAPPVGVVVPVLPTYYTTVWVGGIPYYYANNVYYVQTPQGYAVAAPPPPGAVVEQAPPPAAGAPLPPAPAVAGSQQVYAYPLHNQSAEQQAKDRYECHTWAAGQTGFDPTRSAAAGATATQSDDYRRAMGACLEARGYTVK
jgi:hypothetical protein